MLNYARLAYPWISLKVYLTTKFVEKQSAILGGYWEVLGLPGYPGGQLFTWFPFLSKMILGTDRNSSIFPWSDKMDRVRLGAPLSGRVNE